MTVWYSRRTSGKEVAPESGGQPPDFFLQVPDAVVLFPCVMQIGYYGPLPPPVNALPRTGAKEPGTLALVLGRTDLCSREDRNGGS